MEGKMSGREDGNNMKKKNSITAFLTIIFCMQNRQLKIFIL